MLFNRICIFSILTFLAAAQDTTSISDAQASKVVNEVAKFQSTKAADPAYIAAQEAFTSAAPSSVISDIEADPTGYLQEALTMTALPDWYTALPTSAQNVFSSVGMEEVAIVSKVVAGPAPTTCAKVAGAALAAGAAVLAAL